MGYSLKSAKEFYDVVVIGSGLAGLTAANLLGRNGYKVAVLEQHYNFGGMATWFKRPGGHLFDISLHGFPYGMVKSTRKYWSKEIAESVIRIDTIGFDNPQYSLETSFDRDDFTRILIEHFKISPETVTDFFKAARAMTHVDDVSMTNRDLFQKFFPERTDVWRFLMEPIAYANGSTLDEPAVSYGIVFSNFMDKGVYTFQGGTNLLIRKMLAILKSNGVDVFNYAPADEILVEGGRVSGVRVGDRVIRSNAVLSNAGIKNTVNQLIAKEHVPSELRDMLEDVTVSTSSCQVYLGLKDGESIPEIPELLFTSVYPEFDSKALTSFHPSSRTFSIYYPRIRPGTSRYTIVSSTNALYSDWAELGEEDYEREKNKLIEDTIDCLEGYLPGVSEKLEWKEAATPKTFVHYTQHFGGAVFGTKWDGLAVSSKLPEVLPGAYHAGSVGIIMSGWLGAINYGVIVANKLDEYLADTSREALRVNE